MSGEGDRSTAVRDRLVLPLLLPILAIAAVVTYVLNISRLFLAGGSDAPSVIIAAIVTVVILAGAATISAQPELRSSTLTVTTALAAVLVMTVGLITLGPSESDEETGSVAYREPTGDPTSTLEVEAGPGTRFQSDAFTVPAGVLELVYVDEGESHTLVFDDTTFAGFKLAVPLGPTRGKVALAEGEYTIYCDIPGHRSSGMEAMVRVIAPPEDAGSEPTGPDDNGGPTG